MIDIVLLVIIIIVNGFSLFVKRYDDGEYMLRADLENCDYVWEQVHEYHIELMAQYRYSCKNCAGIDRFWNVMGMALGIFALYVKGLEYSSVACINSTLTLATICWASINLVDVIVSMVN